MSEPPPGAVLMMNSTGLVGGTIATAPEVPDAAADGAAVAPLPVPLQAVATTRPAIASEIDRPIGLRIRCDLPLFYARPTQIVRWSDQTSLWSDRRHRRPGGRSGAIHRKYACSMVMEVRWHYCDGRYGRCATRFQST